MQIAFIIGKDFPGAANDPDLRIRLATAKTWRRWRGWTDLCVFIFDRGLRKLLDRLPLEEHLSSVSASGTRGGTHGLRTMAAAGPMKDRHDGEGQAQIDRLRKPQIETIRRVETTKVGGFGDRWMGPLVSYAQA